MKLFYWTAPSGAVFFGAGNWRLEPIEKQMSGGHLLPPVHKLVATIHFCEEKMVIESGCSKNLLQNAGGSFIDSD